MGLAGTTVDGTTLENRTRDLLYEHLARRPLADSLLWG